MLQITIPSVELWDDFKQEFVTTKEQTLQLEHSLVSLSKWESKWCKPFLSRENKTNEETIDYVRCMTITQNVNPEVYSHLTDENIIQINNYIDAPMTATVFSREESSKRNREIVTSELIYFWMVSYNIPVKFEKWHLNRLLTLIRVCNIKNAPSKKRSRKETASSYAALNAARKKQLNTRG